MFIQVLADVYLCNALGHRTYKYEMESFTHFMFEPREVRPNPFTLAPSVMDCLRKVSLTRGKVLFVDFSGALREALLLSLSHVFQATTYETYMLIRTQNLNFSLREQDGWRFQELSKYTAN